MILLKIIRPGEANGQGGSGCAITSDKQDSYGEFFNLNGGGVFAMLWDDDGIKMCKLHYLVRC